MTKGSGIILILLLHCFGAAAQSDSSLVPGHRKIIADLKNRLTVSAGDSARIEIYQLLNFNYESDNTDSSLKYGLAALELSRRTKNRKAEARTLSGLSGVYRQQGKFAEALDLLFQARKIAGQEGYRFELARSYRRASLVYEDFEDNKRALESILRALDIDRGIPRNRGSLMIDEWVAADVYRAAGRLDSALIYATRSLSARPLNENLIQLVFLSLGNIYEKRGRMDSALYYFRTGLALSRKNIDFHGAALNAIGVAEAFRQFNKPDSVRFYAELAFTSSRKILFRRGTMIAANMLADQYSVSDPATAVKYLRIESEARDSLFGIGNTRTIQLLVTREEEQKKQAEAAVASYRSRVRLYALLAGLVVLLLLSYILYLNNRRQRKATRLLRQQKQELAEALELVKATQAQLVQSEKMASLGQLTAGIAHEIQNPLNFVNNFSELNGELISEMKAELAAGHHEEAIWLSGTIAENEQKINFHGKRAGSIVKSMLQHSRAGTGRKEPADLNALLDEYISLAYHGFRAKNKDFNAELETHFDKTLVPVGIVSQDVGRVFFNLINNGFYAINEKRAAQPAGYKPCLSVTTRRLAHSAEIRIKDNGAGIPKTVLDKIFHPFFTTKPAGEGTGLGLSLSYDIIKAHGGELTVDTKEGDYTEFIFSLAF